VRADAGAARGIGEPRWARAALALLALAVLAVMLVLPLAVVFVEALSPGLAAAAAALREPDALAAIRLTLLVTAIAVPFNTVFGLAAAWCLARHRFPGRGLLRALVGLPLSVSPVIAGLALVLLFGRGGWFGPWLDAMGMRVVFALPGLVIATVFVTLPYVAAQLIPLLEALGAEEEEAALTLGASGWQMFRWVTLPRLRWGLLQGVLLCTARAMGEFGAVAVVSGHIRGLTTTMPLHIEMLYNEYNLPAAFGMAALLALLALVTMAAKALLERRRDRALARGKASVLA